MSDDRNELYYEHSGKLGFAPALVFLLGVPAIAALAAAYSFLIVWCPVIGYVNVLFLGGFILAGSFVLNTLAKWGKSRSPKSMALLGFVCGIIAVYFAWLFFLKALFKDQVDLLDLVADPGAMIQAIKVVNQQGWWEPSGLIQWALSAIEAGAIIVGLTMAGASSIDREVFCEDCNGWCDTFETLHLTPTDEQLATPAKQLKPETLLVLDECQATDFPRLDAEVLQCASCKRLQAIRFDRVTQVVDDGQLKEKREDIPGVLIQRGDFDLG
jgi:hypothetical protein